MVSITRLHPTVWTWQSDHAQGLVCMDEPRGLILITADPVCLPGEDQALPPVRAIHHTSSPTTNPLATRLHATLDTLVREHRWRSNPADQLYRNVLNAAADTLTETQRHKLDELKIWAQRRDPAFPDSSPHDHDAGCPICKKGHEVVAYLLDRLGEA